MEKTELRSVIKFFVLKQLSPREIYEEITAVLGQDSVSYSTIKKWAAHFKCGRSSTEDETRSGRPSTSVTDENIARAEAIVNSDRRVTVHFVAEKIGVSFGSAERILTSSLGMRKVSARWVPRMLTPEQKQKRVQVSEELLGRYVADPAKFIMQLVTQDETWIHHFDPESKQQSMQWKHLTSPPPKKFKVIASAGKVMASVFWDSDGIIMIDYLENGKTITGDYYASLLVKLRIAIKEKRRGKLGKGVLLLHDNAPSHTSHAAVSTAEQCGFEILPHPPYSPDLAPSDFYLFPKLKENLRGRVFSSNDDVISAVNTWVNDQDRVFYEYGLKKLEKRWQKCIDVCGDYVEK